MGIWDTIKNKVNDGVSYVESDPKYKAQLANISQESGLSKAWDTVVFSTEGAISATKHEFSGDVGDIVHPYKGIEDIGKDTKVGQDISHAAGDVKKGLEIGSVILVAILGIGAFFLFKERDKVVEYGADAVKYGKYALV